MELAQKLEQLRVAVQSLEQQVFEAKQQVGEVTELMRQQWKGEAFALAGSASQEGPHQAQQLQLSRQPPPPGQPPQPPGPPPKLQRLEQPAQPPTPWTDADLSWPDYPLGQPQSLGQPPQPPGQRSGQPPPQLQRLEQPWTDAALSRPEYCFEKGLHRTADSNESLYKVSHPYLIQTMSMSLWSWVSTMQSRGMTRLMSIADTALSRPEAAWAAQTAGKKLFSSTFCCRCGGMFRNLGANQGRFNARQKQELAYILMLESSRVMQIPAQGYLH